MEFDRRVQIRIHRLRNGEKSTGFGTGYLIAPRLVLTAAHVLDDMDPAGGPGTVTVCPPDAGEQQFRAIVRWQRTDPVVDAALIEVADGQGWQVPPSLRDLLTRPPQRYGLLIGTRTHPVTATGFPRLQKDAGDGRRLDEQLTGSIAPGTGALAGRYEITSTTPTPGTGSPNGSRWAGMSGAAVLADDGYGGDLLCGVVRSDRRADGGTRLTVTPAAHLLADTDFRALITEHTGWEPVLEPVEPAALLTSAAVDRTFRSPAALLRANTEAVSFYGRDSELADLRAWCENGPPAISVQVLTGPGGQGKTRLARRLTDTLGWQGWVTGHLRSDLTDEPALDAAPPDFTTLTTALPLLLVIDYAETRPRLLWRLITYLYRSRHRVRLLLLARSDGPWRRSREAVPDVRDLLEDAPVVPLAPLIPTSRPAGERQSAFQSALGDFARLLPGVPTLPMHDWQSLATTLRPPEDLSHSRYDNVLTLQTTALVTLLQHGPRPVDAPPGTPPERTLLKHEERFWEASAKTSAYKLNNLPLPTLDAAVAVAALCGASTQDEALQVIATLPDLPGHQAERTAAWLASLYPADGDRYWGSLQPDRIAEYHASHTLATSSIPLPALLAAGSPGQQAQTITVLARAAIAHHNANRITDSERLLHVIDSALDGAPLAREALRTATTALPGSTHIIASFALRLATALTRADRQLATDDSAYQPDLAASLTVYGARLSEVGRRGEALDASDEAVEIYRRLAADNPAVFEPALADSLANHGIDLSRAERRDEALTATEEAVEIYRRLAADNPAAFEPALARTLSNLCGDLSGIGRWDEALDASEEAVEIRRRLAADNPAVFEPDLAHSLANHGIDLSQAERRDEALTATEEAVEIYRRLATHNPAAFEPDLARTLSNLCTVLSDAAEALAATEEAVEIYRRLAAVNADSPVVFEPDLAASLANHGTRLSRAGRVDEALAATEEAVEIYRRLAADNPVTFEPALAQSLTLRSNRLSEVGRRDEALDASEEAVEIRRRLAADNPAAFEPDLAHSLHIHGIDLSQAERRDEALTATEEAVEIYRRLAAHNPAAFEPDLARSLFVLAAHLAMRGDLPAALSATGEAVEFNRKHIRKTLPQLHTVLGLQAQLLDELGRHQEAEQVRRWLRENPLPPDSHN
ncbi:tetratricopeptide repeat protein [Streptomyces sp. NPDC002845]